MGKIIAIAIPTGGGGKTTTALNLAASLSELGKRTLLIDTDPSCACSASLGFTSKNTKVGIFEVFNYSSSIPQVVQKTSLDLLEMVPSNIFNPHMEERYLKLSENRTILKNALRNVTVRYDYIIIDCPPMMKPVTTNALIASDSILVPVTARPYSINAIDRLMMQIVWMREVANKKVGLEGIVLTMHQKHSKVSEHIWQEMRTRYAPNILNTVIPYSTHLMEAPFQGKPAILLYPQSKGVQAYLHLARELIAKNEPP